VVLLSPHAAANHIGIFAIDPGAHTGVAWGAFPLDANLVKDAMVERICANSTTIVGTEQAQILKLTVLYHDFQRKLLDIKVPHFDLVIEDFSLLPGAHTPDKEGISPVRYAWGFVGYIWGQQQIDIPEVHWQLPSNAMRYNQRKFHDSYNTWVKGREHERAAWAHVAARLFKLYQH
jgi:hypothetical protein